MTRLILIRHGESEANKQDRFAGWSDPDLQDKGVEQAKITAKFIKENFKVDKIYSSDLKRAYKTALCLADELGLEVTKSKNLREIRAGKWENMKFADIMEQYPDEYNTWINHIGKARCTDGESVKELASRVMKGLTEIAQGNEGKTVAIATHATPIRASQSVIQTGSVDEMENISWATNASVTVYEYEDGTWTVSVSSLDKHLEGIKTKLPSNV